MKMFDSLQKTDLYRIHQMHEDFEGGCFLIDIHEVPLLTDQDVYHLLDAACTLGKLLPISTSWRKLNYEEGKATLEWGFQNDRAYGGTRLGKKKTRKFCKLIIGDIDPEHCQCFTNWTDDPWKESGHRSWHGVSQNTFDIAVVFIDKKRLVLTYLTSED